MNKIKQILSLVTCLMILLSVAVLRSNKIWGNQLGGEKTEVADSLSAGPIVTADDGSMVVNTTSLGKDIQGFGGIVPLEITVRNGVVESVRALDNQETPSFFDNAATLLDKWKGKTVGEALAMKVDAVSGATYSSQAIIANMQRGLQLVAKKQEADRGPALADVLSLKNVAALIVVLLAAILPLFVKNRRYQLVQMVLNVVVLGFWCGSFLSYASLMGFLANGMNLWLTLVPAVMVVTAFVYPLFGKKSYYCAHVCPFGSLQQVVGQLNPHKLNIGAATLRFLDTFRQLLWAVLMLLLLSGAWAGWTDYEPFSAFIVEQASLPVIIIAIVFVVLSLFVQRPYCRFVCPMGTLLRLSQKGE